MDGRNEPLFGPALDVVRETLDLNRKFEWDLKPMFRLQMAYTLLWMQLKDLPPSNTTWAEM